LSPNVYIIAGPNGAGKSTFARKLLPLYADCPNFVNADLIAQGLSPFAPENAAFRAGRLMIGEIEMLAKQQVDFGFETTLSGRGHVPLVRELKKQGYKIHLFFLWVSEVDLTLSRIKDRVSRGGHNVPEPDVRRRFDRSLRNFLFHYRPLADSWALFDNSERMPSIIALDKHGQLRIIDNEAYTSLVNRYEQNK
jgi:predicted ABC-type ATPase